MARHAPDRTGRLVHWLAPARAAATGFCCFITSNVLWVLWGWQIQAWALIVLQFCLAAMNLRGWKKNMSMESQT